MFTGIIEEIGTVRVVRAGSATVGLEIAATVVTEGTRIGESIAVNGVCLTVTAVAPTGFTAGVMPETLRRSNLGACTHGTRVNLERAVVYGGRVGGHQVQGHVDGVGRVISRRGEGEALVVGVGASPSVLRYVVEKGYIAVDGASLTVVGVSDRGFTVSLVSHTQEHSTLAALPVGTVVNLEVDVVAKYIERLTHTHTADMTREWLTRVGFTAGGEHG